jgi:hypothetical protein
MSRSAEPTESVNELNVSVDCVLLCGDLGARAVDSLEG